jgi:hypothetical protein
VTVGGQWRSVVPAGCCAFLFLLFVSSDVAACSTASNPTPLGRHFVVQVSDRGKSVVGLAIELSTDLRTGDEESRTVSIIRTDANGQASFKGVAPGLYYVAIKHPAFGYSIEIEAMRHPPKGSPDNVTFEWPRWKPLSTQTISGVLTGRTRTGRGTRTARDLMLDLTGKPVYGEVEGARLTLSKAITNEAVDSQTTGSGGKFDFNNIPRGLYFLRVETPVTKPSQWLYPVDGYVPIEVDPSAKFLSLDLVLDNAICGELAWGRPDDK